MAGKRNAVKAARCVWEKVVTALMEYLREWLPISLIWNVGELPKDWTVETLMQKHSSKPYNPAIANVFFLAGFIESWGRGIDKIIDESEKFNGITPKFRFDNGLWVEFYFNELTDDVPNKLGDKLTKIKNLFLNL